MQIAIVIEHGHIGGAESYALSLAGGLARKGHDVRLLSLSGTGADFEEHLRGTEVPVLELPHQISARFRAALSFLRSMRPEVVHVNDPASPVLVASALARVPFRVVTDHVLPMSPLYNRRGGVLQAATRKAAHRVVVFSRQNAGVAQRTWGRVPPEVIHPGVEEPGCPEDGGRMRHRLGIHRDAFLVCTVGRLSPEKRIDVLLRAIARGLGHAGGLSGLIVGDGPSRAVLETLAKELGIEASVRFLGHRHDVGCLLAASDAYVQCSDREGFGLALLEAMAAGLPVIATNLESTREVVGSVPVPMMAVGDPINLDEQLRQFRRDPAAARRLGDDLRSRWGRAFTVERMVEQHERLYGARTLDSPL